ncbi:Gmad2 immunoglobulin-like domain-containing protein [Evansella tamaricis]|uniref:Gmad2 immunoglobulin-like domain-containing protein n=1 Tax=Evansella tamaricis TaxID=2069301 RepID=A0ABS6JI14_9BACI|nr:Gmad2 immunoglobulin-like domain-containing protein [Evansella tamaricis]MBU9713025.1 Gmad2 immunoglobulin-like domain-containing protein [Evansella tamaricis]
MKGLINGWIIVVSSILVFTACNHEPMESLTNNSSDLAEKEDTIGSKDTTVAEENEDLIPDPRKVVIENDAFKIFEPAPHTVVEDRIVVQGLAMVHEGTIFYEVEDGHFIYDSGYTTASSGAPDWGEFELTIDIKEVPNGTITLFLYEESVKDRSRQNELTISLDVVKDEFDQGFVAENEAFKIYSPDPNTEVENQVIVHGFARVFEGTVHYELEDGHYLFDSGFTTTSDGTPEWGEFDIIIDLGEVPNGYVTLILYEESAKDGSRQNEISIPLKVMNEDNTAKDPEEDQVVAENKAFKIFSPPPHEEVANQVIVSGLARVYEATFHYELEDGHYILESGSTNASDGAPEWGEFEIIIDIDKVSNNSLTLILFEESAKDGSRMNELMIPIKVK